MRFEYERVMPHEEGIPEAGVINFLKDLETAEIPMHSLILMRHGRICGETYYAPYKKDTLHRMFSQCKSMVSVGIGILESEGKLKLSDKIVSYFPEKLPEDVSPYLAELTIEDMLKMTACHSATTYKTLKEDDWVGTFFKVKPTHAGGTVFVYDTSATHVLTALIEKLSGMEFLEFLRSRFLDEIGFGKECYVTKDPVGVSMGGSGLMATPEDMLRFLDVVAHEGIFNGKQLLPAEYLKKATSHLSDPSISQNGMEEMQGYGYYFWRITHGGFTCFGMGGQLGFYLPKEDLCIITTADAQYRNAGVQYIYDSFWQHIYPYIDKVDACEKVDVQTYLDFMGSRELFWEKGDSYEVLPVDLHGKTYVFEENAKEWESVSFRINAEGLDCTFLRKGVAYTFPVGFGCNRFTSLPDREDKVGVSGGVMCGTVLKIIAQCIGEKIGSIHMRLAFKEDKITVHMKKKAEDQYAEFEALLAGCIK